MNCLESRPKFKATKGLDNLVKRKAVLTAAIQLT